MKRWNADLDKVVGEIALKKKKQRKDILVKDVVEFVEKEIFEGRLDPSDVNPLVAQIIQFQGVIDSVVLQPGTVDENGLLPIKPEVSNDQIQDAIDVLDDVIGVLEHAEEMGKEVSGFEQRILPRARGYQSKFIHEFVRRAEVRETGIETKEPDGWMERIEKFRNRIFNRYTGFGLYATVFMAAGFLFGFFTLSVISSAAIISLFYFQSWLTKKADRLKDNKYLLVKAPGGEHVKIRGPTNQYLLDSNGEIFQGPVNEALLQIYQVHQLTRTQGKSKPTVSIPHGLPMSVRGYQRSYHEMPGLEEAEINIRSTSGQSVREKFTLLSLFIIPALVLPISLINFYYGIPSVQVSIAALKYMDSVEEASKEGQPIPSLYNHRWTFVELGAILEGHALDYSVGNPGNRLLNYTLDRLIDDALRHPDPVVRKEALSAIATSGLNPEGMNTFIKALDDPDEEIRERAGGLLGIATTRVFIDGEHVEHAVEPLIKVLKEVSKKDKGNTPSFTRLGIISLLGMIGDKRALPTLIEASKDPVPQVREAAQEAIKKIEEKETPPVSAADDQIHRAAVASLQHEDLKQDAEFWSQLTRTMISQFRQLKMGQDLAAMYSNWHLNSIGLSASEFKEALEALKLYRPSILSGLAKVDLYNSGAMLFLLGVYGIPVLIVVRSKERERDAEKSDKAMAKVPARAEVRSSRVRPSQQPAAKPRPSSGFNVGLSPESVGAMLVSLIESGLLSFQEEKDRVLMRPLFEKPYGPLSPWEKGMIARTLRIIDQIYSKRPSADSRAEVRVHSISGTNSELKDTLRRYFDLSKRANKTNFQHQPQYQRVR
ncbi:MAG: HEAT repeat domain-containing protein, partial [Candidatus Aenigmarchaeota archaeon]|nr:HEAT repeat domain-containing protein [Candidatus Aenigmarchaeota archaeon]